MTGGQIGTPLIEVDDKLAQPINVIYLELARDGKKAGVTEIFLYDSPTDLEQAYVNLGAPIGDIQAVPAHVGDKATSFSGMHSITILDTSMSFAVSGLTFVRCQALVHIRITDSLDMYPMTAYAERLAQRLQPLVCR